MTARVNGGEKEPDLVPLPGKPGGNVPERELKFVFSNARAGQVVRWLEHACPDDPRFAAGIVSSVYFDSRRWDSLGEKINSDFIKTKIRLRWYADSKTGQPFDKVFLEVKRREGATRRKSRFPAPFSGAWLEQTALTHPRLLEVDGLLRIHGLHPGAWVEPAFRITYRRRRFVEPRSGVRVSVDWDIRVPSVNGGRLWHPRPYALPEAVLEVKGAVDELPDALRPLLDFGLRRRSFSKYVACYTGATRGA